jgi:hypothetical protein
MPLLSLRRRRPKPGKPKKAAQKEMHHQVPKVYRVNDTGRLDNILARWIRLELVLPTFADDNEARANGLDAGRLYRRPNGRNWVVPPLEA